MKILALNSSPRAGGESKTGLMLEALAAGMREAGAEVTIVNLAAQKIKDCVGCFTCWTKTPGRCLHRDDMTAALFGQWSAADMAVYATPLYNHRMNAAMGRFIERTLPALQPFFERRGEATAHPLRQKIPAAVWLSVCGLPEPSEFNAFSEFLKRTCHPDATIAAEIYRPAAEMLGLPFFKTQVDDILEATRAAGRELVQTGRVAAATLARIGQPLTDVQTFADLGNIFWRNCIDEKLTPKQFGRGDRVPRPANLEEFMQLMRFGFDNAAVDDGQAYVEFRFDDDPQQVCHFLVRASKTTAHPGPVESPQIRIETPFDLWADIMTGQADGPQMFLEQRYRVEGDLDLMIKFFQKDPTR